MGGVALINAYYVITHPGSILKEISRVRKNKRIKNNLVK